MNSKETYSTHDDEKWHPQYYPKSEQTEQDFDSYDEVTLDLDCPKCGRTYDEIDYEYQICHYCKFNNNKPNK